MELGQIHILQDDISFGRSPATTLKVQWGHDLRP